MSNSDTRIVGFQDSIGRKVVGYLIQPIDQCESLHALTISTSSQRSKAYLNLNSNALSIFQTPQIRDYNTFLQQSESYPVCNHLSPFSISCCQSHLSDSPFSIKRNLISKPKYTTPDHNSPHSIHQNSLDCIDSLLSFLPTSHCDQNCCSPPYSSLAPFAFPTLSTPLFILVSLATFPS